MGCACRGRDSTQYLWYSTTEGGDEPKVYKTEVEAKAKQIRKGGEYMVYNANLTIEQNIVADQQTKASLRG